MRTIEQIREHLIEQLGNAIRRPGMYIYPGKAVGGFLYRILADLCFIDERENDLANALDEMNKKKLSNNMGVFGAFHECFDHNKFEIDKLFNEVASIYAEVAWNLGYLKIERILSEQEWTKLQQGLRAKCQFRDWFQSEIEEQFGKPSLKIGHVNCYVSKAVPDSWIYFDCWVEHNMKDGVTVDWKYLRDPILRNVRLPASTLTEGLIFTPYGQRFSHDYADMGDNAIVE